MTSNVLENVYSYQSPTGIELHKLVYSSLISCAVDSASETGYAYSLSYCSNITLQNCGSEGCYNIFKLNLTKFITIDGCHIKSKIEQTTNILYSNYTRGTIINNSIIGKFNDKGANITIDGKVDMVLFNNAYVFYGENNAYMPIKPKMIRTLNMTTNDTPYRIFNNEYKQSVDLSTQSGDKIDYVNGLIRGVTNSNIDFTLNSNITMAYKKILDAYGEGCIYFKNATDNTVSILLEHNALEFENIESTLIFENITFRPNVPSAGKEYLIKFTRCKNVIFKNCIFDAWGRPNLNYAILSELSNIKLINCETKGTFLNENKYGGEFIDVY